MGGKEIKAHLLFFLETIMHKNVLANTKWKKLNTDFPLLMILRVSATSLNEGLSAGSSAQQSFIRVKMAGCTPSDSCWGSGGR